MDLEAFGNQIAAALPTAVLSHAVARGELTIEIKASEIVPALKYLRDDPACKFEELIDICGVDWPARAKRFDVVYHLLSVANNARVRVKIQADETTPVPSVHEVFVAAIWFERETFDMYGVTFAENPDLSGILTDYGFSGHPLRKDFPLTGYVEVHYDEELKRVVYRPVKLVQEFRDFDFISPWEGAPYILPDGGKSNG